MCVKILVLLKNDDDELIQEAREFVCGERDGGVLWGVYVLMRK